MKSFLERLTLVIHWIGLGSSVFVAYLVLFELPDDYPIWFTTLMILIPNTLGWLIKYIFTGNGKYLPF